MVACMCNKHSYKLLLLVQDLFLMHLNFVEFGDKINEPLMYVLFVTLRFLM